MTAVAYRMQPTDEAAQMLARLLHRRQSCRGFLPDQVDVATIRHIMALAQRTPSWCNAQPWQMIVTRGAATDRFRDGLSAHAASEASRPDIAFPRDYLGRYRDRRRECGLQLYDAGGVARGDRTASARQAQENFRLFGAPHVAIITSDEALGQYGTVDCGAYVTCFMLAAATLGVASIAQASIASHSVFVRRHFDIPEDRIIVCGISFGFADPAHPANGFRTTRAAVDDVLDLRS